MSTIDLVCVRLVNGVIKFGWDETFISKIIKEEMVLSLGIDCT